MKIVIRAIALCAILLGALPAAALADWRQPVGGASPINNDAGRNGDAPSLALIGGVPYIAWNEDTTQPGQGGSSQIRVARLTADGSAWEKVANNGPNPISKRTTTSSETPSLTSVLGVPWVAFAEGITADDKQIRVARLKSDETGWERVPDQERPINNAAGLGMNPDLEDASGRPYVSWWELDPGSGSLFFPGKAPAQIWVSRLNEAGDGWDRVGGGSVNLDPAFDAAFPSMEVIDGRPWVTFFQVSMTGLRILVFRLNDAGDGWEQVGDQLNSNGDPEALEPPTMAVVNGRPAIAWGERGTGSDPNDPKPVHVVRLNDAGDGWETYGSNGDAVTGDAAAEDFSLADIGGRPWLSWRERASGASQIRVSRLNLDDEWETVGSSLNDDPSHDARDVTSLASINGFPWVGFPESDGAQPSASPPCCAQIRVSRLEPDFGGLAAFPSDTKASLLVDLRNYGLPFPVGFEYGKGGFGSDSAIVAANQSGDEDTVFTEVSGLTPSTLYRYRAFATAGTPQPRARGGSSAFLTGAAQAGGGAQNPAATRLFVALLRFHQRVRSGRRVPVYFLSTDEGAVELQVWRRVRGAARASRFRQVDRVVGRSHPGRNKIIWDGRFNRRRAPRGRYSLRLVVTRADGAVARDASGLRILRKRR